DGQFYRLHVLPIHVASLAERREDVPLLASFFCAEAVARHGLPRLELSPNALRAVDSAEWPAYVRQLEYAVGKAAIRVAAAAAKLKARCPQLVFNGHSILTFNSLPSRSWRRNDRGLRVFASGTRHVHREADRPPFSGPAGAMKLVDSLASGCGGDFGARTPTA